MVKTSIWLGFAFLLAVPCSAAGQNPGTGTRDLAEASLEDLMNIQVTSVSKKQQKLSQAGAAIFVISQEDIRRSGATNIPDLLRMVPGVNVAQIVASVWAISIRGFNDRYGDKVLVMIDGRSVYSPTTSGVNWDQQDVPLEDIERIEVIRGPGGVVWGANAMNGIINIITLSAKATQGGLLRAGTGSKDSAQLLAQYGGTLGQKGAYRIFGNYANVRNSDFPDRTGAGDGWHKSHVGFRSDWEGVAGDRLTVQGDLFKSSEWQPLSTVYTNQMFREATLNDKETSEAGNLLGRWTHMLSSASEISLQAYYDRYQRGDRGLSETRNTVDVEFQNHFAGTRNDIVWGLGYRVTGDYFRRGYGLSYTPAARRDGLANAFFADEIKAGNSLWITVGSRFEHNSYTGFEYEPNAQLVWTPAHGQEFWMSASRAIREPARADVQLENDVATFRLDNGGLAIVKLLGTLGRQAERLHDFEAGYRAQIGKRLSVDIAAFSSHYLGLQTNEPGAPYFTATPAPFHLVTPILFEDDATGHTYGGEVFANWSVTRRWRLSPGFSYIHMHVQGDGTSQDPDPGQIVTQTPARQFQIRSSLTLPKRVDWDSAVSYVGSLRAGPTPSHTRLDSRLGWRIGESVEFSLVGQNLLQPRHAEFIDTFQINHTLVERSVFGKVTWRF
ncbi:MAG: TonB-dependent receptor [Acidobacteriota bacterium]|nr:TonB-dependent receptor [Acidobacteriota bacterium]